MSQYSESKSRNKFLYNIDVTSIENIRNVQNILEKVEARANQKYIS